MSGAEHWNKATSHAAKVVCVCLQNELKCGGKIFSVKPIFRGVDFMEKFHKTIIFYPLLRLPKSRFFFSTFHLIVAWQLRMPACCLIICKFFFCTKVEFALTGFCNSKVIHSYFRTTTTFFVPKNH